MYLQNYTSDFKWDPEVPFFLFPLECVLLFGRIALASLACDYIVLIHDLVWHIESLLWNYTLVTATETHWWQISIGVDNGLVSSSKKPLLIEHLYCCHCWQSTIGEIHAWIKQAVKLQSIKGFPRSDKICHQSRSSSSTQLHQEIHASPLIQAMF